MKSAIILLFVCYFTHVVELFVIILVRGIYSTFYQLIHTLKIDL